MEMPAKHLPAAQENARQTPQLWGSENLKVGEHTEVPERDPPPLPMMINLPNFSKVSLVAGWQDLTSWDTF